MRASKAHLEELWSLYKRVLGMTQCIDHRSDRMGKANLEKLIEALRQALDVNVDTEGYEYRGHK